MMQSQRHVVDSIPLGGIVTVRDRLLELQARGKKVYRLESGDPSFQVADHIREAIKRALDEGQTHYTAGTGIKRLREEIYRKVKEANRIPMKDPEHVLVTNGAMNGLYIAFGALVHQGDEVVMPDPTWTETADNVTLAGGVPVRVRLNPLRDYNYEPEAVEDAITPRARVTSSCLCKKLEGASVAPI
jgi:aspartate aminotransferase